MSESGRNNTTLGRLFWSIRLMLLVFAPLLVLLWAIEFISLTTLIICIIAPLILLNIKWVQGTGIDGLDADIAEHDEPLNYT